MQRSKKQHEPDLLNGDLEFLYRNLSSCYCCCFFSRSFFSFACCYRCKASLQAKGTQTVDLWPTYTICVDLTNNFRLYFVVRDPALKRWFDHWIRLNRFAFDPFVLSSNAAQFQHILIKTHNKQKCFACNNKTNC